MRILITGSSGLVGSALMPFLFQKGHEVVRLVRTRTQEKNTKYWDPQSGVIDPIENIDAVIHLAGENLGAERWSDAKKKRIMESRVQSTLLLCKVLSQMEKAPKVLLSASAIGYYGNRGDDILRENSGPGSGFLSEVCQIWEKSTEEAAQKGIRVVCSRFGLILSKQGGALEKMLLPFQLGLGGVIGNGKQYVSWISIDDAINAIYHILISENLQGAVNVVSPEPVTNQKFTKTLGHVLHRPTLLCIPSYAPHLMLGEMADELLLYSARVIPIRLQETGFVFQYPKLEKALHHLLRK